MLAAIPAPFPLRGRSAKIMLAAALLLNAAGCSLVSLKERPLSARDLNARVLTREYSAQFIAAVEKCADDISAKEQDQQVLINTLRWEIAAASHSVRAATQITPMMGVLDTWALAVQMQSFVAEGSAGGSLFGASQNEVRALADDQARIADQLASLVIVPSDLPRYRKFVQEYVRDNPIEDLAFTRTPIVARWTQQNGADVKLVDSLGTIPESMSDISDRMRIYGEALPTQALLKTRLAIRESGLSGKDMHAALDEMNGRIDRMAAAAEKAPDLVHDAIVETHQTLLGIINRLNESSLSMIQALHEERIALTADVRLERAATLAALDEQRKALALDAAKIGDQFVVTAGEELRRLARDVLILLIILSIVVLGLPFAAGYMVGRNRRRDSA
ncbi:MAG TPA: hypothetical protein VGI65_01170 [Steroidobacteraceae bacterium]